MQARPSRVRRSDQVRDRGLKPRTQCRTKKNEKKSSFVQYLGYQSAFSRWLLNFVPSLAFFSANFSEP